MISICVSTIAYANLAFVSAGTTTLLIQKPLLQSNSTDLEYVYKTAMDTIVLVEMGPEFLQYIQLTHMTITQDAEDSVG